MKKHNDFSTQKFDMENIPSKIGLIGAIKILLKRRKLLIRNSLIAGVVFGLLSLCVPRYYKCEVTLAPEYDSGASLGSFASIASSLGINLGSSMGSDAISPTLYPDVISSKEFIVSLFNVKVTTEDGKISTDYFTYLAKHQALPWWTSATRGTIRFFKNLFAPKAKKPSKSKVLNPFRLTEREFQISEAINSKISCDVDPVSTIITINVTDQDPLVCASLADSVREHLQEFITRYRTSKARNDMAYYKKLMDEAKYEYTKATIAYSNYADSHKNVIMQSYISQRDELENSMRMKFNVYTALQQQLESAKAKVQERTPAFTTLKCASVPIKPAGPKRVIMTILIMILTFCITAFYILKGKKLLKQIISKNTNNSSISTPDTTGDNHTQQNNATQD